jgi:hypothetical protein
MESISPSLVCEIIGVSIPDLLWEDRNDDAMFLKRARFWRPIYHPEDSIPKDDHVDGVSIWLGLDIAFIFPAAFSYFV